MFQHRHPWNGGTQGQGSRKCRPGRRGMRRGTALAIEVPGVIAGAGGSPLAKPGPGPAASALSQPKRGGALDRRASSAVGTPGSRGFDPRVLPGAWTRMPPLSRQDRSQHHPRTVALEPEIAQSWETPVPTELAFAIAASLTRHGKPAVNGRALAVDDSVVSLTRARANGPPFETVSPSAPLPATRAPGPLFSAGSVRCDAPSLAPTLALSPANVPAQWGYHYEQVWLEPNPLPGERRGHPGPLSQNGERGRGEGLVISRQLAIANCRRSG
jgi:hypothetical protein